MASTSRRLLLLALGVVAFANLPVLGRDFADLDDWTHIGTSLGLLRGDPAAWNHVLLGRTGVASVRPGSAIAWAANVAVFGFRPLGYFATNLALHVALAGGVFALVHRIGRAPWAAAVAATAVGLSAATHQPVYYLSGRDDLLANGAFVAAVLLWQGGRDRWSGRVGVALIYGLGALCKPTILPLPLLLLLDDGLRDGRAAFSPRRLLGRYGPLLLVAGALVAALSGVLGTTNPGSLFTPEQRDGLAAGRGLGRFAGRVAGSLLLPLFAKEGGVSALVFDAPRVLLLVAAVLSLRRRGVHGRLLILGLGWLLANLAMPLPFVVMESWRAQDAGRYLQLPLIGFGLMTASLLVRPPTGRWTRVLAPALVLVTLLPFLMRVTPTLGDSGAGTRQFVRALQQASTDVPADGRVIVAMRGPDHGLASLAASFLLEEQVPSLPGKPYLFLEGSRRLHRNTQRGATYDYARFTALRDDFALRELDAENGDRLVAAQPGGGWAQVVLDPRIFGGGVGAAPAWDFARAGAEGWTWRGVPNSMLRGVPRDGRTPVVPAPSQPGVGVELYVDGYLPPAVLDRAMGHLRQQPTHLLSPPLDLQPTAICGLTLSLTLPDRVEPSYAEGDFLVPSRRFALLGWSEGEGVPDAPFERYLVVPLSEWAGPQSVTVALDNSPGWLATGRVRRLALLPANVPGPVDVGSLVFMPCS